MAGRKRYVVTVGNDRPLAEVETGLRGAGLDIEQSLAEIGVVVGTADTSAEESIGRVDGVDDVSAEVAIDVGPPGAPDSW